MKKLSKMNKADLKSVCDELGVAYETDTNNSTLQASITGELEKRDLTWDAYVESFNPAPEPKEDDTPVIDIRDDNATRYEKLYARADALKVKLSKKDRPDPLTDKEVKALKKKGEPVVQPQPETSIPDLARKIVKAEDKASGRKVEKKTKSIKAKNWRAQERFQDDDKDALHDKLVELGDEAMDMFRAKGIRRYKRIAAILYQTARQQLRK